MKYPKLPPEQDKRRKLTIEQIDEIIALHDAGMSERKIAAIFEVSRNAVRYHCMSGIEREKLNRKRYELIVLQEKRSKEFKETRKEKKIANRKDILKRYEPARKYKGKTTYKWKKKRYHTDEKFRLKTQKQAMESYERRKKN